jgi:hypothetical protein
VDFGAIKESAGAVMSHPMTEKALVVGGALLAICAAGYGVHHCATSDYTASLMSDAKSSALSVARELFGTEVTTITQAECRLERTLDDGVMASVADFFGAADTLGFATTNSVCETPTTVVTHKILNVTMDNIQNSILGIFGV